MSSQKQDMKNISLKEGFFFPYRSISEHWRDFILLTAMFSLIILQHYMFLNHIRKIILTQAGTLQIFMRV